MKHSNPKHSPRTMASALLFAALLGGLGSASLSAMAAEKLPPGDIPDTQAFVAYASPSGFSLQVPEGWARTERAGRVTFTDQYDAIDAAVTAHAAAPTIGSVRAREAADLVKTGRAVKIESIQAVKLAAGPAILVTYSSNSEPNPVTGKQLRLESHRYLIHHGGKLATLDLAAPLGADNADQWHHIADSFRWR